MAQLKKLAVAGVAVAALLTAGCEDRSRSVLDRDEGTVEETREALDRAGDNVNEEAREATD
jgi:hypothetical protein